MPNKQSSCPCCLLPAQSVEFPRHVCLPNLLSESIHPLEKQRERGTCVGSAAGRYLGCCDGERDKTRGRDWGETQPRKRERDHKPRAKASAGVASHPSGSAPMCSAPVWCARCRHIIEHMPAPTRFNGKRYPARKTWACLSLASARFTPANPACQQQQQQPQQRPATHVPRAPPHLNIIVVNLWHLSQHQRAYMVRRR